MRHNIPIYLANVKVRVTRYSASQKSTITETKILSNIFMKGFTFADMIRRKGKQITGQFIKGPKDRASIIDIEILSQHGRGVDD